MLAVFLIPLVTPTFNRIMLIGNVFLKEKVLISSRDKHFSRDKLLLIPETFPCYVSKCSIFFTKFGRMTGARRFFGFKH